MTGDVVALRREEDVAVGAVEAQLADVELFEQEVGDDVERAEARAEMAGSSTLHGDQGVQAAHVRYEGEALVATVVAVGHRPDRLGGYQRQVGHRGRTVPRVPTSPTAARSTNAGTTGRANSWIA